ncbi:MAG: 50S ribosomal protein L10 [Pseudomonadota bacterium]
MERKMQSPNRVRKESWVKELNQEFAPTQGAIVMRMSGVTVADITTLRSNLRKRDVRLRVMKNTLAQRAIVGTPLGPLTESLRGPTVVAYTKGDVVGMAKALTDFARVQDKKVQVCAGVLAGKLLSKEEVTALANLPSREVLLARVAGALASPYAGLVYALSGVLRKLVYALDAVRRQKEQQG